ncbi:MAG: histidine phosphatase family protein [Deltaproteobacteria bacterium]|nr:histidine phosphatase family protein [Deltaproteobacteria bacterium]MBW1846372.1 histidine phosphatase family protein [Deltaproteobacteria bacterium]MBW2181452.1 histidine phosphatase family protein [Deltaproteobacteria bacterium]MBW2364237.1 histidine phosphatase family protein [Deltaproteobacteria bacterium]
MELIIIRHGLPLRVEKKDNTPADPGLSETGIKQAEKLGQWLKNEKIDAIYSSPMKRARMTAEPLAKFKGIEINIDPSLAEFDVQSSKYVPMEELRETDYELWKDLVSGGFEARYDMEAFRQKVLESLDRISAENKGKRVTVVCHGGLINTFAAHVLGIEKYFFFAPEYTCINRFLVASSGLKSIVSLNEFGHLRDDLVFA